MRVTVVGTGYVGTVTAACLAWLGDEVWGLEKDPLRAAQLAAGQLPFLESGLPELLRDTLREGKLKFTDDPDLALDAAQIVVICVGTPSGTDGLPDLSDVEEAVETIGTRLPDGAVIANKSTLPIGWGNFVRRRIEQYRTGRPAHRFSVVSLPEFLREGTAINDFLHPDRIVVGGERDGINRVLALYRPIVEQSFPGGDARSRPQVFVTDLASAEMIKYAANAFLATKVSFANEIATLCELMGADARRVLPAVGADRRIGSAFLGAGAGWGGSCLPKDVAALIAMGRKHGYRAPLLRGAVEVNRGRRDAIVDKLRTELQTLEGRRIAVLGLAFKPETNDLRQAPALYLIGEFLRSGAKVAAYDPGVKALPSEFGEVRVAPNPYETADDADAVVLVTDWEEFATLDLETVAARMNGDLLLDGRNVLDQEEAAQAGLRLVGVGWNT